MVRQVGSLVVGLILGSAYGTPRHRIETRQLVFEAPGRRVYKTLCAKLMCTADTGAPADGAQPASSLEWEGTSNFDLPYSFAYVIDVAVNAANDSDYGQYSTIVDTGSANLGIAEEACSSCGGSSTSTLAVGYTDDVCISVLYGDSGDDATYWSGYESSSVVAGFVSDYGEVTTSTTIAAITEASSGSSAFFTGGYSGILGLAYAGIAEAYYDCESKTVTEETTPIVDALYAAGKMNYNIFTLSFCGLTAPLVLGDIEMSDVSSVIEYTDAQKTLGEYYGYYMVKVESFEVGGEDLGVDISEFNAYGGMLVDSGTTELILPTRVYVAFAEYLLKTVDWLGDDFFEYNSCLTEDALSEMPGLTLGISNDMTVVLPPQNYLIYYEGCYYWGVAASTMSIWGNVALQGLTTVFDREDNMIGFATASCSETTSSVSVDVAKPSQSRGSKTKKASGALRPSHDSHIRQGAVKHKAGQAGLHLKKQAPKPKSKSSGQRVVHAGIVPKSLKESKMQQSTRTHRAKAPARLLDRYPRLTPEATMQLRAKLSGKTEATGQHSSFLQTVVLLGSLLGVGMALLAVRSFRQRTVRILRGEYQLVADNDFEM